MTIGIYKLNFSGTNKCYIGQSKINIEKRFTNHIRALKNNCSSCKLQEAYNLYGLPTLEILLESDAEDLDDLEREAIIVYNSINNGFNNMSGGSTGHGQYGETAPNSLYDNTIYCNILKMLSLNIPVKEIAKELDVSYSVVRSINKCENHKWLEKVMPEEYAIVKQKHISFSPKNNHAEARGIQYPPIVEISTGKVYNVISLRDTARTFKMCSGGLHKLLTGKLLSLQGFVVAGNTHIASSKYLKDSSGNIHEIPYRGMSEFARVHGLAKSTLSNLINKKRPEYNGWTLYEVCE